MEKELKVNRSSERPTRAGLGHRNRISLRERDPNYQYRLVNCNLEGDPDRVAALEELGYEIVPNKVAGRTGDAKVDNPSTLGSASEISVGRGDRAVWMRIRKDWFEEDQKAKQKEIDSLEKRTQTEGADYGKVTITSTKG